MPLLPRHQEPVSRHFDRGAPGLHTEGNWPRLSRRGASIRGLGRAGSAERTWVAATAISKLRPKPAVFRRTYLLWRRPGEPIDRAELSPPDRVRWSLLV